MGEWKSWSKKAEGTAQPPINRPGRTGVGSSLLSVVGNQAIQQIRANGPIAPIEARRHAWARVKQGVFAAPSALTSLIQQWHAAGLLDPPIRPAGVPELVPVLRPDDPEVQALLTDVAVEEEWFAGESGSGAVAAGVQPQLPGPPGLPPGFPPTLPIPPAGPAAPTQPPPEVIFERGPGPSPRSGPGKVVEPGGKPGGNILIVGTQLAYLFAPSIARLIGERLEPGRFPGNWTTQTNPITGQPIEELEDYVWLRGLTDEQLNFLSELYRGEALKLPAGDVGSDPVTDSQESPFSIGEPELVLPVTLPAPAGRSEPVLEDPRSGNPPLLLAGTSRAEGEALVGRLRQLRDSGPQVSVDWDRLERQLQDPATQHAAADELAELEKSHWPGAAGSPEPAAPSDAEEDFYEERDREIAEHAGFRYAPAEQAAAEIASIRMDILNQSFERPPPDHAEAFIDRHTGMIVIINFEGTSAGTALFTTRRRADGTPDPEGYLKDKGFRPKRPGSPRQPGSPGKGGKRGKRG